ncbi:hypothetical protein AMJ50_00965 [Parcubacteria bacterium DG_74_3]|nr:MAG: hypothetical protein AMJ50_00965 [Parcubacteria bacterium DG_74_3]
MKIDELIINELIKSRANNRADLDFLKRKVAKKYKIPMPSNIRLLKLYHELLKEKRVKKSKKIENLLKTRPVRSLSGIVNVSVLTKPYPCPGRCLYCPLEAGIPKSYLSGEPAVERAKKMNYNPFSQVKTRIESLDNQGHPTDKIELRIIGGTWSFYPKNYQTYFIKRCFDACNREEGKTLKEVQKRNERAKHKIVGLSVETRPDFITKTEIKRMRKLGITRVELGVQSTYDDVLKLNIRGHGVQETILATKLLKDTGFKICYQMMLNLLGSNLKKDKKMFEELFRKPDFRPDLLKIYPCALLKEAPLYRFWKRGKYRPYTKKRLINLIKEVKKKIPYYVRIQRIARDIPSPRIIAGGSKLLNVRQVIARKIKSEGWRCRCIRCREIREDYNPKEKLKLFRQDYRASGGREIFLSFENKNRSKLYSLLRLRVSSQCNEERPRYIIPVLEGAAIIREVHTYGQLVPVAERKKLAPQHQGLGKKLIREAEKIIKKEWGLNKITVIAAVGTRDYFRKLGYRLKDEYMIKSLS